MYNVTKLNTMLKKLIDTEFFSFLSFFLPFDQGPHHLLSSHHVCWPGNSYACHSECTKLHNFICN